MSSKIKDYKSKIKKIQFLSQDIVSMYLNFPLAEGSHRDNFDFSPGQFLMLETPGFPLRRPFVIVDKNGNDIRIIFKLRGEGTHLLSRLSEGTELKVLGPLGESFPEPDPNTEVILAGGGIGIVTLLPMAKYLTTQQKAKNSEKKLRMFMGANNKDSLILMEEFKNYAEVITCTDDGSCGTKTNTVELIKNHLSDKGNAFTIYACGPNIMLKALGEFTKANKIKCHVSLEERMACGVGACLCCAVKTTDGIKRVCKEGPSFDISKIKWDFEV